MWVGKSSSAWSWLPERWLSSTPRCPGGSSRNRLDPLRADMAFTTLTLFQLFNVFNARSDTRSAFDGLFANRWLWGAVGLSLCLHAAAIYTPFLQEAFSTVSLSPADWLWCIAAASSVLWLRELEKGLSAWVKGRRGGAPAG